MGHWEVFEGLWRRDQRLLIKLFPIFGVPDVLQHAVRVVLCLAQLIDGLLILEDIDGYLAIVFVMLVNQASLLRVFTCQLFATFFVLKIYLAAPSLAALPQ